MAPSAVGGRCFQSALTFPAGAEWPSSGAPSPGGAGPAAQRRKHASSSLSRPGMKAAASHSGDASMRPLISVRRCASAAGDAAHAAAAAMYSSRELHTQSDSTPIAVSSERPTLCAWQAPLRVTTGTPMKMASQVVVVPGGTRSSSQLDQQGAKGTQEVVHRGVGSCEAESRRSVGMVRVKHAAWGWHVRSPTMPTGMHYQG